jgi:HK97 family phage major capsid protein/HK97 family phage prohead protease
MSIKALDISGDKGIITGIATTPSTDRYGEIVEPKGAVMKLPLPLLWQHAHDDPIGQVTKAKITDDGIEIEAEVMLGSIQRIDAYWTMIKAGLVRGLSIGFRVLDDGIRFVDDTLVFTKWEWLELSAVTIPANADATINVVKSYDDHPSTQLSVIRAAAATAPELKALVSKPGPAARQKSVAKTTQPRPAVTPPNNPNPGVRSMKIGERIEAAEKRASEIKDEISTIVKAVEDDGRSFLPEETAQIEALEAEAAEVDNNLKTYRTAEKAMMRRAAAAEDTKGRDGRVYAAAKSDKPSDLIVKAASVAFVAKVKGISQEQAAKQMYANDPRMEVIAKAAVPHADTLTVGWAAELVETAIRGFMDELVPLSVWGRLTQLGTTLVFDGYGGVTIPGWDIGDTLAGSFVREGAPIPVKRGTFMSQTLTPHKMAVISSFTSELAERSTPSIEALIRTKMLRDTGKAIDTAVLDALPGVPGLRPPSLVNGVVGIPASGTTSTDIIADFRKLFDTIHPDAGNNLVLMMHPRRAQGISLAENAVGEFIFRAEIDAGRFWRATLVVSSNVPEDKIVLMEASDFVTAAGQPVYDVSNQATLVMLDDNGVNPTMNMDQATVRVDQAAGVAGGPARVQSLFQQDTIGIRMKMSLSWGLMRQGMIGMITGAAY